MEKYVIRGGHPLQGKVTISGAKNAAVGILPATILAEGPCVIENVPNISDVGIILEILREMGGQVKYLNRTTVEIDTANIAVPEVPYELAKHMRASYYFLGACWAGSIGPRSAYPEDVTSGCGPLTST